MVVTPRRGQTAIGGHGEALGRVGVTLQFAQRPVALEVPGEQHGGIDTDEVVRTAARDDGARELGVGGEGEYLAARSQRLETAAGPQLPDAQCRIVAAWIAVQPSPPDGDGCDRSAVALEHAHGSRLGGSPQRHRAVIAGRQGALAVDELHGLRRSRGGRTRWRSAVRSRRVVAARSRGRAAAVVEALRADAFELCDGGLGIATPQVQAGEQRSGARIAAAARGGAVYSLEQRRVAELGAAPARQAGVVRRLRCAGSAVSACPRRISLVRMTEEEQRDGLVVPAVGLPLRSGNSANGLGRRKSSRARRTTRRARRARAR
jgi:hypothetical protein